MRMGIGLGVGINRSNYAQGIFGAYATRVVADGGVVEAGACVDAVSGLLLSASLLLIPSGYKGGKLYAEIPTNGNGDLTWTRASTAIRTNSSGLLESMATGVPRLSYMYGSCPSVLLEPQRTNIITWSEDLTNADWIKAQATVSGNNTTAPDGNNTADKLIINNGAAGGYAYQAKTTTSGTIYTGSFYVKAGGVSFTKFHTNISGSYQNAVINLSTGAITNSSFATTPIATSVGNGWYRVSYTVTSGGSNVVIYIDGGCTSTGGTYTGNGTDGIFVWGFQAEIGSYPTTYIPTTSATATRVADSFSRSNIYTNGLITSSGGTWFFELDNNISLIRDASSNLFIGTTNNGNTNTSLGIRNNGATSQRLSVYKRISGTLTLLYLTLTDTIKVAIKWNGTTADVFVNGVKVNSATAFTTTNMEFLQGDGLDVPKYMKQMALYPSLLSDTDCTTLTTL